MNPSTLGTNPLKRKFVELARVQAQRYVIDHSFSGAQGEYGLLDYLSQQPVRQVIVQIAGERLNFARINCS